MLYSSPPALVSAIAVAAAQSPTPLAVTVVTADWELRVSVPGTSDMTVHFNPPTVIHVRDERIDAIPAFDDKAAPWACGTRLPGLITQETTAPDALVPGSLRLRAGPGDTRVLTEGTDYKLQPRWGTFGSVPGGGLVAGSAVWADYDVGRGRIDSVVRDAGGKIVVREGAPDVATPHPPVLLPGDLRLVNVWLRLRLEKLTDDVVFPIAAPTTPASTAAVAQTRLPKTWAKLTTGGKLSILAWGDSVTAGGASSDAAHRYQEQFVARLHRRFPTAEIELTTVAWPGRNTASFLAEPSGSPYNFQEKVLDAHPDLVVMEFVNDAGLNSPQIEERYSGLLTRFQAIGAEWAILTPHFVWGEWMGTGTAKVMHDPRPYVAGLHEFVTRHRDTPGLALADASRHWELLAGQGLPYQTLLANSLNHPDDRGHAIFADALMELFATP